MKRCPHATRSDRLCVRVLESRATHAEAVAGEDASEGCPR
jgi:hypothetical protein